MAKRLLAVFGGGAHMLTAEGPWVPTADFETWPLGTNGGRPLVRETHVDDNDPNAVIAMGELLLEAAVVMYTSSQPNAVAIAYGDSSPSFVIAGHPSENEIMNEYFEEHAPKAHLETFNPVEWNSQGKLSGTYNEAANLLRLMKRDGFNELVVVYREAHLRAMPLLMMRLQEPEFADLEKSITMIEPHTVESILLWVNPDRFADRIAKIRRSQAYRRFLLREGNWWYNFVQNGSSQIIQKPAGQPVASVAG